MIWHVPKKKKQNKTKQNKTKKNFGFIVGCKKPSMILVKLNMLFAQTRLWCYQCNINTIILNQLELKYPEVPMYSSVRCTMKFIQSTIQTFIMVHFILSDYQIMNRCKPKVPRSCFPSYTFRHPKLNTVPSQSVPVVPFLAFKKTKQNKTLSVLYNLL